jgi:hypothetical protein
MYKDVPIANATKSIIDQRKAPLRPIYPRPEAMPFKTIVLDFITKLPEFCRDMTPSSQSLTMTAPRQLYSYHAGKKSMQKALQHYISNMFSPTLDYHKKSLAIKTPSSCQNLCKKYAVSQESSIILPQHITQEPMGNQNILINGSRLLFNSSQTTIRPIGLLIYLLHNLHITIGPVTPCRSPLFSF